MKSGSRENVRPIGLAHLAESSVTTERFSGDRYLVGAGLALLFTFLNILLTQSIAGAGDLSSQTVNPRATFSGVRMQQGNPQLDSDRKTQQLNSPTLNVNKPIPAPKALTTYSPHLNRSIAPPKASSTIALHPAPNRDVKPVPSGASGSTGAELDMINVQNLVNQRQQAVQQGPKILHQMDDNCFQCIQNIGK